MSSDTSSSANNHDRSSSSTSSDKNNCTTIVVDGCSFRLELVPLPAWSHFVEGGVNPSLNNTIPPHKMPWVATIFEELRRTDNILITEIGTRGLLEYLQGNLMATSINSNSNDVLDDAGEVLPEHDSSCDWEFQDDKGFWYIMEILQANMIHFLKRRYFDMERCRDSIAASQQDRHYYGQRSPGIAEDFRIVFDKASSTRYLTNRQKVDFHCFKKTYQQKRKGDMTPKGIQNALVRLHHRAGIYLPASNVFEMGIDSYWIDLWWVLSSLLVWILEPCLKTMLSAMEIDPQQQQQQQLRKKRRIDLLSMTHTRRDVAGFAKQSQQPVVKIPFGLIRAHTQRLGLFYDKAFLHDGPWDEEEPDEDYLVDDDDEDGIAIVATILAEAKEMSRRENVTTTQENPWEEGRRNTSSSKNGKETIQQVLETPNEQREDKWARSSGHIEPSSVDYEDTAGDRKVKVVYDSFWANGNENFATACSSDTDSLEI